MESCKNAIGGLAFLLYLRDITNHTIPSKFSIHFQGLTACLCFLLIYETSKFYELI